MALQARGSSHRTLISGVLSRVYSRECWESYGRSTATTVTRSWRGIRYKEPTDERIDAGVIDVRKVVDADGRRPRMWIDVEAVETVR